MPNINLKKIGVVFLVILVTFLFAIYWYLKSNLPDYSESYAIDGIQGEIRIERDQYAVPQIYAEHQNDLAFGMGYVMAQDRLWQMDLFRRVATGRLSEVFGKRTLTADRFAKISGFDFESKQLVSELPSDERSYLNAFVDGINFYTRSHPESIPFEFLVLNYRPDDFTPEDIMALSYYKSYVANHNWKFEVLRAMAIHQLGEEKGRKLVAATAFNGPYMAEPGIELDDEGKAKVVVEKSQGSKSISLSGDLEPLLTELLAIDEKVKALSGLQANEAHSNYWALSGRRTQSGGAMFANDYHMPFLLPSLWYQIRLVGDGIDASGITMPGSPTILAGHNQYIAWGATTTGADTQDLYWEKLNPENENEYLYENRDQNQNQARYIPFKSRTETILVRDGEKMHTEALEVRLSRHGPIINDILSDRELNTSGFLTTPLALKSVDNGAQGQMTFAMSIYRSKNWNEFKQAISHVRTPVWNWGYADAKGNIGYKMNGRLPKRKSGNGLEPQPGWTEEFDWNGYLGFNDLPENYNPESGFIVSANNEVVGENRIKKGGAEYLISGSTFQLPYRAIRIEQLIKGKEKLNQQDVRDIQLDTQSLFALRIKQEIMEALEKNTEQLTPVDGVQMQAILNLLKNYRGETDVNSVANTIIQETFVSLLRNTFVNKMKSDLFDQFVHLGNLNYVAGVMLATLNDSSRHHWFDNPTTEKIESKEQIIAHSFIDALHALKNEFGSNYLDWRWGKIHQIHFKHQLGDSKIGSLVNLKPRDFPGDIATVNPGVFHKIDQKPYIAEHGASMRHIVNFAEIEQADLVTTSGQSGSWLSDHYDDQYQLWVEGKYLNTDSKKIHYKTTLLKPIKPTEKTTKR